MIGKQAKNDKPPSCMEIMKRYATAYAFTAFLFLLLDGIWLGFIAKDFFQGQLGPWLREEVNLTLALAFYLFYALGITIFGVRPALHDGRWQTALIFGGLFGFFAYATYDMTNYITLENWPGIVVLVDLTWGTVVTALSAVVGWALTHKTVKPAAA